MNSTDQVSSGILDILTTDGLGGFADEAAGIIFLIMLATTLIGGIIAFNARQLIHAVQGLAVCFIGVAAIYYYLNSPFLAMMQMLIYVGAVCITISFAILLAAPEEDKKQGPPSALSGPFGIITAGMIAFAMISLALRTEFTIMPKVNMGGMKLIGSKLLTTYSMVFELVSIVLLIAIIGSLVIGRKGRSK
jgi:NADH-quinone oxidoreductase subunit J